MNTLDSKYQPLSKGDFIEIGDDFLEILWLPRIIDDKRTLNVIKMALKDFEKALDIDEETRRLYCNILEKGLFRKYFEAKKTRSMRVIKNEKSYENKDYPDTSSKEPFQEVKKELPIVVQKANESLAKAQII